MLILNSATQNNTAGWKGRKEAQITLNQPRYHLPTLYLSFSQECLCFFYRESSAYKALTLKDETTKALLPLDYKLCTNWYNPRCSGLCLAMGYLDVYIQHDREAVSQPSGDFLHSQLVHLSRAMQFWESQGNCWWQSKAHFFLPFCNLLSEVKIHTRAWRQSLPPRPEIINIIVCQYYDNYLIPILTN